jgi:hypothetical protein
MDGKHSITVRDNSGALVNDLTKDDFEVLEDAVPQNIAEGNGKRSLADRQRFFEIARGSALESAASLDILVACGALTTEEAAAGKCFLHRTVSMLTRMTAPASGVPEDPGLYAIEYEHEHRCAEHEHER